MGTRAIEVQTVLEREGLRQYVNAIEDNPATPGEVVLWPYGVPIYSVREAVDYVRRIARGRETV